MTPSELKAAVEDSGKERYFFTRESMKFFGDTLRNYGVRAATVKSYSGEEHDVWELYRKRPVKHGLTSSAYFTKDDFRQIITAD